LLFTTLIFADVDGCVDGIIPRISRDALVALLRGVILRLGPITTGIGVVVAAIFPAIFLLAFISQENGSLGVAIGLSDLLPSPRSCLMALARRVSAPMGPLRL
jgi:hypothetical protein